MKKLTPFESFPLAAVFCIAIGLIILVTTGSKLIAIGAVLLTAILFSAGITKVDTQWEGVFKVIGMRWHFITFKEGYHPSIPVITKIDPVDIRERVIEIGTTAKPFVIITGIEAGKPIRLTIRALFRYDIDDAPGFQSFSEEAINLALINAAINFIRKTAPNMTDDEFITSKEDIADKAKQEIDDLYKCINVTSLEIPSTDWTDPDVAKAKQELNLEMARSRSQDAEAIATRQRVVDTAAALNASGLSKKEATQQAIDLVQSQEKRKEIKKIELGGPLKEIAGAIIKALKK